MRPRHLIPALCLAVFAGLGLAANSDQGNKLAKITGTIEFKGKDDAAFAPDAVATVQVLDVSKADAKAVVLGKVELKNLKSFPIPFEVQYDAADIKPNHRYSLGVRITSGSKLDYINDTSIPVINDGPTKDVKAYVIRVKRPAP